MADAAASVEVRPATPEDAATIVEFVRLLAEFEHEPVEQVHLTEEDVRRDGFGDARAFEALIAELNGAPVGFALFFPNYSTWEGRPGIYVEDIYVREEHRSGGVGETIMRAVARLALERGAARIDLAVLDWNPARSFYERLGLSQQAEWLPYRLDRAGIEALAEER
jgi:GNAT superfamily N-acetyltransferase